MGHSLKGVEGLHTHVLLSVSRHRGEGVGSRVVVLGGDRVVVGRAGGVVGGVVGGMEGDGDDVGDDEEEGDGKVEGAVLPNDSSQQHRRCDSYLVYSLVRVVVGYVRGDRLFGRMVGRLILVFGLLVVVVVVLESSASSDVCYRIGAACPRTIRIAGVAMGGGSLYLGDGVVVAVVWVHHNPHRFVAQFQDHGGRPRGYESISSHSTAYSHSAMSESQH